MPLRLPRLQFSLRTLVILMVIVAALASWHGSRYARFKARLGARLQAQEHGLVFYTREEAGSFPSYTLQSDMAPSLAERWDLFWFGHEAGQFPACEMSMRAYIANHKSYAEKNHRAVFELHPEIELAVVSGNGGQIFRVTANQFQRVAWYIGYGDTTIRLPGVMSAVNDFARLPNLRYFQHHFPSFLDESWVAALPESSSLLELHGEQDLNPAAVMSLIHKAPQLLKLELSPTSIPDEVRIPLQEKYSITEIKHPTRYLLELKQ